MGLARCRPRPARRAGLAPRRAKAAGASRCIGNFKPPAAGP